MGGTSPIGWLLVGPYLVIWAVLRLVGFLRDAKSLLREDSRAIRPDELVPMHLLRTRMALTTTGYVLVILVGTIGFWVGLEEALSW